MHPSPAALLHARRVVAPLPVPALVPCPGPVLVSGRGSSSSSTVCRAEPRIDISKFANKEYLDKAAKRYAFGMQQGLDEDDLVAMELGVPNVAALPASQVAYKDKIKEKLIKRAEELQREEEELKERMSRNFKLGKQAYEFGEYATAVTLLEQGVEDAGGPDTQLAGEIQLWLALAYQACGREQDAIDLYKVLEETHPNTKVRRQAAELRYVLEAPKLEIGEDERVKIPLIQSETWRKPERRTVSQRKGARSGAAPAQKSYWDAADWDLKAPSLNWVPDKWYIRVLWAALIVGVTVYLNWSASGRG